MHCFGRLLLLLFATAAAMSAGLSISSGHLGVLANAVGSSRYDLGSLPPDSREHLRLVRRRFQVGITLTGHSKSNKRYLQSASSGTIWRSKHGRFEGTACMCVVPCITPTLLCGACPKRPIIGHYFRDSFFFMQGGTTIGYMDGTAMGIVTQWAIRLQTSDFYGPSPPTPNTQAPHDRPPPPPNIRLVDKWKMGKYGTSENVQHGGKHSTPPPLFRIIKVQPPPPTRHIGTSLQENGDKRAVPPPPPPPQRHGNFTSGKWWVGENMPACVHVMLFALLSLAAIGKVSKHRRGHPLVESSCLRLTLW